MAGDGWSQDPCLVNPRVLVSMAIEGGKVMLVVTVDGAGIVSGVQGEERVDLRGTTLGDEG